jgi:hypothetical protein
MDNLPVVGQAHADRNEKSTSPALHLYITISSTLTEQKVQMRSNRSGPNRSLPLRHGPHSWGRTAT